MMPAPPSFSLPELTKYQKTMLLKHAEQVLKMQNQMTTQQGKTILHYTLQKKRRHKGMDHYPSGDRIDKQTGAQYFYHCHRENLDQEEHGHFHCFLRYKHVQKRIKPKPLEDWKKYLDNPMTHIIAISMNRYGQPIRLFTVNRWVTSEIWYDAEHAPSFIKRFKIKSIADPHWTILDQWVEGMLRLFSPQISWLHRQRDETITRHQLLNPGCNVYEDRSIEELSELSIDLKAQIQWLLN